MPRPDIKKLAKNIKTKAEPPKVDYWMLQANIFMQQLKDAVREAVEKMPDGATGKVELLAIMKKNRDQISEEDIRDYQELLRIVSNKDVKSRAAISKAMFEVPDVAGDAFKVLEELDTAGGPPGENTLEKHERLLKEYTTSSPTSSLMTNPNGNKDRMFSVSGVDYDPMGAGRIPYGYSFHDRGENPNARQVPISTGTPVKHSGGSAYGLHLFSTYNIGKDASVHGAFHSYLEGICGAGADDKNKAPPYNSGVIGDETYPEEDGDLEYVYINLQKHDANIIGSENRERIAESVRSDALYREINSYKKAACLTLPADNKFFWQGFDRKKASGDGSRSTSSSLLKQIADSISEKKNDFIIPDKVLRKMYEKKGMEIPSNLRDKDAIEKLIQDSFKEAVKGITGSDDLQRSLDAETRSAVMLHFVKATLTDQILNATNPKRFNITCKDAIDRAGTHNLWLQIHRKLNAEPPQTIERSEVERFLDGLAMAYKHRPANEHRDAFINAMGKFYNNLDESRKAKFKDGDKDWDIGAWLDANCRTKPTIPIIKPENIDPKPKGFWNSVKKLFRASYNGTIEVQGRTLDVRHKSGSDEISIIGEGGKPFNYTSVYDKELHSKLQEAGVTVSGSSITVSEPSAVESSPSAPSPNKDRSLVNRSDLAAAHPASVTPPSDKSTVGSPITYGRDNSRSIDKKTLSELVRRSAPAIQERRPSKPAHSAPAGPRRTQ